MKRDTAGDLPEAGARSEMGSADTAHVWRPRTRASRNRDAQRGYSDEKKLQMTCGASAQIWCPIPGTSQSTTGAEQPDVAMHSGLRLDVVVGALEGSARLLPVQLSAVGV